MVTTLRPAVNTNARSFSTVQTPATTATGPAATVRASFTGRNGSDLGSLTHLLVGSYARQVRSTETVQTGQSGPSCQALQAAAPSQPVGDALLNRMFGAAYDLIRATPNASRVLATEAASLAYRYFTDYLPDPSWLLLGVEYDTGAGRVDLAWVHDRTGVVFYDEVKTSRVTHGHVPPARWVQQARRYSVAGAERHGEEFLGTRLIPLTAGHVGRLVLAEGTLMLLAPTGSTSTTNPAAGPDHSVDHQRNEPTGSPDLRLVHGRAVGGVR